MLKALYDYAVREKLTLPPGYVNKPIKAYICLSSDGRFLGVEMGNDEPVACPDIGSLANGKDKSNLIVEKYSVIFPKEESAKNRFFRDALKSAGEYEADCLVCLKAIEDTAIASVIKSELDRCKIKDSDRISFIVDGTPLVESDSLREWWGGFRQQFVKNNTGAKERCVITGQLTTPVATVPKVTGLRSVGGHSSGDSLICFDKASFCSYGLKQAANAPVSEEAIAAVKVALDELLKDAPSLDGEKEKNDKKRNPIYARNLGGIKFVHWYDHAVKNDILNSVFDGDDDFDMLSELLPEDSEDVDEKNPKIEERKADALVESYRTGAEPSELQSVYHILFLTGVGGRVMIRNYERGNYGELCQSIRIWNHDLELCRSDGTGLLKSRKLTDRLIVLLKRQKLSDSLPEKRKKWFNRLAKELSGITPLVLNAIFTGASLPNAILVRALAYIRSAMLDVEEGKTQIPDSWACQWLKAYLCRKERIEGNEVTMAYCNPDHPKSAYHCGRLMAVYASIQREALGKVGAGVVERYYASACQTPALVFGRLAALSNHHLSKMENQRTAFRLSEMLNSISVSIGDEVPVTLTPEDQAYFALGYRQQYAEMTRQKIENAAKKKENKD